MTIAATNTVTRDLTSQVDGIVTSFTTPEAFNAGTLIVYLNGKRQQAGDFFSETSSTTFSTTDTPQVGDELQAQYEIDSDQGLVVASGTPP